jgi:hypothetical protein
MVGLMRGAVQAARICADGCRGPLLVVLAAKGAAKVSQIALNQLMHGRENWQVSQRKALILLASSIPARDATMISTC